MRTINLPIENQVPDLETCKKLQEVLKGFGIELDCEYVWMTNGNKHEVVHEDGIEAFAYYGADNICPAPLFTELWRLLPAVLIDSEAYDYYRLVDVDTVSYMCLVRHKPHYMLKAFLDNARVNTTQSTAELLLWVAENHPKELTKHLEEQ